MPSIETETIRLTIWMLAILAFGCLGTLIIGIGWCLRIISEQYRLSRLAAERNEQQRDRLLGQMIEYRQTWDGGQADAFRVANLHAGEHREAMAANLHRDGMEQSAQQLKIQAEGIKTRRLSEVDVPGSEQEAM